jgi:orotidine-5'-phosphate decarboxylase
MDYLQLLKNSSKKHNSIVCLGLDPIIEKIPLKGSVFKRIVTFYEGILNGLQRINTFPGSVKPNYAFYAQYGLSGIKALQKIISIYRSEGFPVILDVKRGDIGTTAAAYAKESFEFFSADAVTLSPYMGLDSILPFMIGYPDKGYYILTKTSNKSSSEIQDLHADGCTIYEQVAKKIVDWYRPGIGSVVGATYPKQLRAISSIFSDSGKEIPLLIPGIGSQGGSLKEIMELLHISRDISIHRINSSSAINYAYIETHGTHFSAAAAQALQSLNEEIGI